VKIDRILELVPSLAGVRVRVDSHSDVATINLDDLLALLEAAHI